MYDAFALLAKRYEGESAVFSSRSELVRTLSNLVVEPAQRSLPLREGQAHVSCYPFMRLHPSTSLRWQGMFTAVKALFSRLRRRQSCTTVKGRTCSTLPAQRPKYLVARAGARARIVYSIARPDSVPDIHMPCSTCSKALKDRGID